VATDVREAEGAAVKALAAPAREARTAAVFMVNKEKKEG